MTKEEKFYRILKDVFIGAKIECIGGFVNLMRIKSNYYQKIKKLLKKVLKKHLSFRNELFGKIYNFFNRYFTGSGSVYFNSTIFCNNIYEKFHTNEYEQRKINFI